MDRAGIDKTVSPNWKRPEEVMKFHKLKQRKRALSARMSGNDNIAMSFSSSSNSEDSFGEFPAAKRRNPFARRLETNFQSKSSETTDESGVETDISSDTTLFQLLNNSQSSSSNFNTPKSFANILQHLNSQEEVNVTQSSQEIAKVKQKDGLNLPIDWSLKSKVRLMSAKSFLWSANLRTCEEASGITGFVRCLDVSNPQNNMKGGSLDTSPNAKFLQCCLYWQHPNLPWLQLFPRNMNKVNASLLSAQLQMSPILQTEWTIAFKSLFQLVRTRQCPFFYFIANHFQCLFRAAGIGGVPETHVIITPTTRGFRKMLDDEEVVYTMPLKKKRKSNEFTSDSDSSQLLENEKNSGDEEDDDWLESMGVDAKEMKRITMSQKNIDRTREKKIDGSSESMVVVQGIEVQALFNLLINCKSCISSTGPFTGVPPTLISPTAFQLATLKSCKVRDSMIRVDGIDFHSIQIEGPIMPHALRQICILLNQDGIEYSASLSIVKQTVGFTNAFKFGNEKDENQPSSASSVFLKENLSDCGLPQVLLNVFCDRESEKYGIIESIEPITSDS